MGYLRVLDPIVSLRRHAGGAGFSELIVDLLMAMIVISIGTGMVIYSIRTFKNTYNVAGNEVDAVSSCYISPAVVRVNSTYFVIVTNYGTTTCNCTVLCEGVVLFHTLLKGGETRVVNLGNSYRTNMVVICNGTAAFKPQVLG